MSSALFPETAALDPAAQREREGKLRALFAQARRQPGGAGAPGEPPDAQHRRDRRARADGRGASSSPGSSIACRTSRRSRRSSTSTAARTGRGCTRRRASRWRGSRSPGAWVDVEKGLLGTIVLEMGGSSRLCAALKPGEPIILMGPTGTPTEIAKRETVLLCGGGLGNAVLFSIARAFKALGGRVLYFAGYRRGEDLFKREDIEQWTDEVIWCTDTGAAIEPHRPQDQHFRGNIVAAMHAYATGKLGPPAVPFREVKRIIAIGSDGMMNAVREARHGVLAPLLDPRHLAIGSINSPMQCMMKEVCAQCLQTPARSAYRQGARRLHVLQSGPGARRRGLPQLARAVARQLDAGEALERLARRAPPDPRRGDSRLNLDGAFWRALARAGAAHGPEWFVRFSPPLIGLAACALARGPPGAGGSEPRTRPRRTRSASPRSGRRPHVRELRLVSRRNPRGGLAARAVALGGRVGRIARGRRALRRPGPHLGDGAHRRLGDRRPDPVARPRHPHDDRRGARARRRARGPSRTTHGAPAGCS